MCIYPVVFCFEVLILEEKHKVVASKEIDSLWRNPGYNVTDDSFSVLQISTRNLLGIESLGSHLLCT